MEWMLWFRICIIYSAIYSSYGKNSKLETKVDALDYLFRGELYLVNEKIERGRQEREILAQRFNETLEFLENSTHGDNMNSDATRTKKQNDELRTLSKRADDTSKVVDRLSDSLICTQRGMMEEKKARKSDANVVNMKLDELLKTQDKLVTNVDNIVSKLEDIFTIQDDLRNKVNDITSKTTILLNRNERLEYKLDNQVIDISNMDEQVQKRLAEVGSTTKHLSTDVDNVARGMKEIKDNVAPRLYCDSQLDLDTCLQKHFKEQESSLESIRAMLQPVQLVGGAGPHEGRVEVNYGGRRGTICDDKWSENDAIVVCKMLGFNGGTALKGRGEHNFGEGRGEILLDDVECYGGEESIFDCEHAGIGVDDCSHVEDAAVKCLP